MNKNFMVTMCTVLILLISCFAQAEKHALLIGVGSYPLLGLEDQLDGPPHDVAALKEVLMASYGFKPDAVKTLVDDQATKDNIMTAIHNLVSRTLPRDSILIYFSGHGTGGYDPLHKELGIDPFTGAIIPSDFKPDGDIDRILSGLIIGKRDLRPLLTRLDKDRNVTVIFDSCYSGDAVRGINKGKKKRVDLTKILIQNAVPSSTASQVTTSGGVKLGGMLTETVQQLNDCSISAPPYPYRNVIYFSASSRKEPAEDIGTGLLATGMVQTVDGLPHGAMTDALLRGLKGAANTDNDNRITYDELYHYIRGDVSGKFRQQTPSLLHASDTRLDTPLFDSFAPLARPSEQLTKPDQPLKVKTQGLSLDLEEKIAAIPKVIMVDKAFDMLVKKESDTFALYLGSGGVLADIPLADPSGVVERISRQVQVKSLVGFTCENQSFNLFVDVVPAKGVFVVGDTLGFVVRPQADCYLLLLNIDPAGNINIIYPDSEAELAMVEKGNKVDLTGLASVLPPHLGTEYIKALAFKSPLNIKPFMGKAFLPGDTLFKQLMNIITRDKIIAQTTLQVKTAVASHGYQTASRGGQLNQ